MLVWSCQMYMDCRLGHLSFKAVLDASGAFRRTTSGCGSEHGLVVTSARVVSVLLWLYVNALQGWSSTHAQWKWITAHPVWCAGWRQPCFSTEVSVVVIMKKLWLCLSLMKKRLSCSVSLTVSRLCLPSVSLLKVSWLSGRVAVF